MPTIIFYSRATKHKENKDKGLANASALPESTASARPDRVARLNPDAEPSAVAIARASSKNGVTLRNHLIQVKLPQKVTFSILKTLYFYSPGYIDGYSGLADIWPGTPPGGCDWLGCCCCEVVACGTGAWVAGCWVEVLKLALLINMTKNHSLKNA